MRVFVLLFNARTENEGIHTLQIKDRNVILMFQSEDDATRFAYMLEAQDFPLPTVEGMDDEEIREFCQDHEYECQLVEEGTLDFPPERNVEKTDWTPEGQPEAAGDLEEQAPDVDTSDLDSIRSQLEKLL